MTVGLAGLGPVEGPRAACLSCRARPRTRTVPHTVSEVPLGPEAPEALEGLTLRLVCPTLCPGIYLPTRPVHPR